MRSAPSARHSISWPTSSAKATSWSLCSARVALLSDVDVDDLKVSVYGGPVFQSDDRVFRGVALPREYWKVIAFVSAGTLTARAFVLTQNLNQLESLDLDEFRVFQVRLDEVERRCGFTFPAGVPREAVATMEAAFAKVHASREWQELVRRNNYEDRFMGSAEFTRGYTFVDATLEGKKFRFFNTHLEVDGGPAGALSAGSLLVAALVAGLAKQLAVLLLGHPLAALLDH